MENKESKELLVDPVCQMKQKCGNFFQTKLLVEMRKVYQYFGYSGILFASNELYLFGKKYTLFI